jgi:hypothetical protein
MPLQVARNSTSLLPRQANDLKVGVFPPIYQVWLTGVPSSGKPLAY